MSGNTYKLVENAHTPCPAPDGPKIAVIALKDDSRHLPQDIKVVNTEGDIIRTLNCKDFGLDFFSSTMMWSADSGKLVIKGYEEGNMLRKQYVVVYDYEAGCGKAVELEDDGLRYSEKNILFVGEDGQEIAYSQLGRVVETCHDCEL